MKRFFYSAMCLTALALTFSCSKPEGGNDDGGDGNPTKLATPVLKSSTTADSFTITWDAVENATAYTVLFNDAEENVTETSFNKTVEPGAYIVKVKAISDDAKYEASDWAEITVVVESSSEAVEGDGTWFGTWKLSYTKTIIFDQSSTTIDEAKGGEREITMEEGDQAGQTYVFGWSKLTYDDGSPAVGLAISLDGTELATDNPNDIALITGVEIAASGTVSYQWAGYCDVNEGSQYSIVSGQYPGFIFDINDGFNQAELVAYEGGLDGGGTFVTLGMEIFGYDSTQPTSVYFLGQENWPFEYPAGGYSLVKTANAASVASKASVSAKTLNNVNTVAATSVAIAK